MTADKTRTPHQTIISITKEKRQERRVTHLYIFRTFTVIILNDDEGDKKMQERV